jgi:molybdopterin converting factor subunit 1
MTPMTITVLYFASLREQAGAGRQTLELPEGLRVRDLARHLEAAQPGLRLAGALCAINERYAAPDDPITAGDTVAFLPPVSGG